MPLHDLTRVPLALGGASLFCVSKVGWVTSGRPGCWESGMQRKEVGDRRRYWGTPTDGRRRAESSAARCSLGRLIALKLEGRARRRRCTGDRQVRGGEACPAQASAVTDGTVTQPRLAVVELQLRGFPAVSLSCPRDLSYENYLQRSWEEQRTQPGKSSADWRLPYLRHRRAAGSEILV